MTRYLSFTFGIYFCCLNNFIFCKNHHIAFTGCNATLQWNLGNRTSYLKGIVVRINDTNGNVIISTKNNQCTSRDNLSVSCVISQKNDDWIISLSLINITTNHSGNYTAWIKQGIHFETLIKQLIVIYTPQIMELGKPIHHKSFAVTCNVSYVSDSLTYHWKINGADLNDTTHIQANSSTLIYTNLTMMDNLSKLVCHLGIKNSGNVTCNCSSQESEAYTVLLYYGPNNVSLTANKSDIYLQDNEMFKVKCWANCYPDCTFKWESNSINADNNDLVINSFNERMSGAYTCFAKNRETGVTSKSNPIFLHHKKVYSVDGGKGDTEISGSAIYLLGVGLGIVMVSLIIVGVLIYVTHRHKSGYSSRLDAQTAHTPFPGPTNTELPLETIHLDKHDIPLPIPTVHEITRSKKRRSWYPNINRISTSLQTFLDHDQDSWSPAGQSLSLQSLIQLSHMFGRRTQSDVSLRKLDCPSKNGLFRLGVPNNGIRTEEQYSKVTNKKESIDEQHPRARSLGLDNVRPGSFEETQGDLYSSINENIWSGYDYATVTKEEENLHNRHKKNENDDYDYDYVTLPALL